MKTKLVDVIIKNHIELLNSVCNQIDKSYREKSPSACVRRIELKRQCITEYDALTSMLRIACALGDCEISEFEKLEKEIYEKFQASYYRL